MDACAHIFYQIDGEMNYSHIVHGFYGQEIHYGEKLIFMIDEFNIEIIFTNNKFSVSCIFDDRSLCSGSNYSSVVRLALVLPKKFDFGVYYNMHMLGFYANDYTIDLPNVNSAIREYDDLIFNEFGIKRKHDKDFFAAMCNIYEILHKTLVDFESYMSNYIPERPRLPGKKSAVCDEPKKYESIDDIEFSLI